MSSITINNQSNDDEGTSFYSPGQLLNGSSTALLNGTYGTTSSIVQNNNIFSNNQPEEVTVIGNRQPVTTAATKRVKNPLSYCSSYTYQLSLYMITPDAYDAFVTSGRKNINALVSSSGVGNSGGVFLIAQSGGINDTIPRAPGFNYDLGIDNLKISANISSNATASAANAYDMSFTITEPYGFSFVQNLQNAQTQNIAYAQALGKSYQYSSLSRQFFIIGIRFFGYDKDGNLLKGTEPFNGSVLDPNSSGNGLFTTY